MRSFRTRVVSPAAAWLLLGALAAGGCVDGSVAVRPGARREVLVYTRTAGFRHDSIPAAVAAIRDAAAREGLDARATEDPGAFTPEVLRGVAAVVFLLTTGEVLDAPGQEALKAYVHAGGGFLGVHSAADTLHGWPWYLDLVGAEFVSHPAIQRAVLVREDAAHPATAGLPPAWSRVDEWYDFLASPRATVHVLLSIDEASYRGGGMGADHPMAWCRVFDGGRAAYTALGHTVESWSEPLFLAHLGGALRWVARLADGRCDP